MKRNITIYYKGIMVRDLGAYSRECTEKWQFTCKVRVKFGYHFSSYINISSIRVFIHAYDVTGYIILMQWYLFVIRHIYVDALKLWKLWGHWKCKSIQCFKIRCCIVEEVVSPREFTCIFCPRGSFCFLGSWLIFELILLLQKHLEYHLVENGQSNFTQCAKLFMWGSVLMYAYWKTCRRVSACSCTCIQNVLV